MAAKQSKGKDLNWWHWVSKGIIKPLDTDELVIDLLHHPKETKKSIDVECGISLNRRIGSLQPYLQATDKTAGGSIGTVITDQLLHPDGKYTKEDVRVYLEWAIEMRRRVKEQLKRIGGMEFWDTSFSYIDKETQKETFVPVPEERGSGLIGDSPLPPGTCYSAASDGDKVALVKIEVITMAGN